MYKHLIDLVFNLLPTIIVAIVAYHFFSSYVKQEDGRRRFLLHKENQKTSLPLRIQAYERLALFLERISPGNLLTRIKPLNDDKHKYESLLIRNIEQEYEHNLTQQIYVTEECWNVIRTSKNATISIIRKTNMSDKVTSSNRLRETILRDLIDISVPSETGLAYIKKEVNELF